MMCGIVPSTLRNLAKILISVNIRNMTIHYHSGFDYFTPDTGTTDSMSCRACGTEMQVERNVDYYGRWGKEDPPRKIDKFTCNNSSQNWHNQVISLRRFQRDTPSKTLEKLVEEEITLIIESKTPTKDNWRI